MLGGASPVVVDASEVGPSVEVGGAVVLDVVGDVVAESSVAADVESAVVEGGAVGDVWLEDPVSVPPMPGLMPVSLPGQPAARQTNETPRTHRPCAAAAMPSIVGEARVLSGDYSQVCASHSQLPFKRAYDPGHSTT